MDMAMNSQFHFLNETQQCNPDLPDVHRSPKTFIVKASAFNDFLETWEELSTELLAILNANTDPYLYSAISRARGET